MLITRLVVFSCLLAISVLLAGVTTYGYGALYSHDRYWNGTIARVQRGQVALVRSLLVSRVADSEFDVSPDVLSRMFEPTNNKLIVEVVKSGGVLFSNFNGKFKPGALLDTLNLSDGTSIRILRYQPPTWNYLFLRWLRAPSRWFTPSYDYVTVPFLWFLAVYLMAMVVMGLFVKSSYLERDVISTLRKYGLGGR